MIKKSFAGMDHFISDNEVVAFSWAAYSTRDKECLINNEKYFVQYHFNKLITFNDNTYIEGNILKFENVNTGKCSFLYMDEARTIREENELESHLICFNEDQFLSA